MPAKRRDLRKKVAHEPKPIPRDLDPFDDRYWEWHVCCSCRDEDGGGYCCTWDGRCPPAHVYRELLRKEVK